MDCWTDKVFLAVPLTSFQQQLYDHLMDHAKQLQSPYYSMLSLQGLVLLLKIYQQVELGITEKEETAQTNMV